MKWQSIESNWVLTPPRPKGVVHFLGGAFLAAAPQVSYSRLLENLAQAGYVIVATPFLNSSFDHRQIAADVYEQFAAVREKLFLDYFPTFGMGHSMGCKIHLILSCLYQPQRLGNIFLAYNNYSAKRSIPFFRELTESLPDFAQSEFSPSPDELNAMIADRYKIEQNLLVKFFDDDIDEIPALANLLSYKFGSKVKVQSLPGNHLTSLGVEVNWQPSKSFSPIDALGQWLKQETNRDNDILQQCLLNWMTKVRPLRQTTQS
ncbi:MAG: hypothetical protein CV045_07640 [Cyanobacteria bacterium M5B4]|nr:MAG: hypothetical protein CV045_07640 [Cyanobacteria bacterium M5B4]